MSERERYKLEQTYYDYLLTLGHTEEEADMIALKWAVHNPPWQVSDIDLLAYNRHGTHNTHNNEEEE